MRDEIIIRTKILLNSFLSDSLYGGEEAVVKEIIKFYRSFGRHQYHLVSRFVYEQMQKGLDTIDYMLSNIFYIICYLKENIDVCNAIIQSEGGEFDIDQIIAWIEKLYDHIALEEERLINNSRVIEISKRDIERGVINRFDGVTESFQKRVEDISNTLNANIMTVVGLFSAIIFVFFGGITSLASFVDGVYKITSTQELRYPLLMLLIIGWIMFNTIFLLLYSISKIVNKNIGCEIRKSIGGRYSVEPKGDECYVVINHVNDTQVKCFCEEKKATRHVKFRTILSDVCVTIINGFKRVLFRFPIVFCFNLLIIIGIIYLLFYL